MKKYKKPERGSSRPSGASRSGGSTHPNNQRPQARANQPRPNQPPQGRCVVGIHAVTELLNVRPRAISKLWLRDNYLDHPGLKELAEKAEDLGVKIQTHPAGSLDKIVSAHQGVLAFTDEEPEFSWSQIKGDAPCTLIALDEVEDPHNLGAVLRTSWLLGAQAVLTPEHRSAQLSPAVSKVAQGAVEHVPVVRDGALPQQLKELKDEGFWILGLSHKAKQDLYSFEVPQKVVWVLGSESSGLRKSVENVCDDLIAIPQGAPNASYNVSVAAALALGETFRQRLRQGVKKI